MDVHSRADVSKGEPFSMCMVCLAEVESEMSECPKCHVPTSLVRKCPGCSKIISSLHQKCVYCGWFFVPPDAVAGADTTDSPNRRPRRDRSRVIRAAAVSIGVFTVVFTVVLIFSRRLEQRNPGPRPLARLATSYALRRASVYRTSKMDAVAIGHVPAGTKLEVLDFETAGTTPLWWRVRSNDLSGYAPPSDFAPPRVIEPERGYALLHSSITTINDSETMVLAIEAVQYYRSTFPKSAHRDELLYWTAEQARQIAEKNSDGKLLARARALFTVLTGSDDFAQKAHAALDRLPAIPVSNSARNREQPRAPGIEIIGASRQGRSSGPESAQKIAFISATEVLVKLPALQGAAAGTVVQGRTARDIKAGDMIVPAGSLCELKVVGAGETGSASTSSVLVQLTGLQVSGRLLPADGVPTQVPVAQNGNVNRAVPPVALRLKKPLLIPQ